MNSFPIYIPSKGRSDICKTSAALSEMNISHFVVVEPSQADAYTRNLADTKAEVLEMDMGYKDKYDPLDDYGATRSTGPGPARNFLWDHSIANGHKWHWTMDDNIPEFYRLNKNMKHRLKTGAGFSAMEDFCLRYENVAMAGPNYEMFVPRKKKVPPFVANTRIYSCNLIRNDVPFRWRGRYNEDTILSLDMLKAGWCTIQFNAFLQNKLGTQTMRGGNTDEFYHVEGEVKPGQKYTDTGTLAKSQMQVAVHPDVSKLVRRFGRIHHHVNYAPFKKNRLVRKAEAVECGVNNYGMELRKASKGGGISPL